MIDRFLISLLLTTMHHTEAASLAGSSTAKQHAGSSSIRTSIIDNRQQRLLPQQEEEPPSAAAAAAAAVAFAVGGGGGGGGGCRSDRGGAVTREAQHPPAVSAGPDFGLDSLTCFQSSSHLTPSLHTHIHSRCPPAPGPGGTQPPDLFPLDEDPMAWPSCEDAYEPTWYQDPTHALPPGLVTGIFYRKTLRGGIDRPIDRPTEPPPSQKFSSSATTQPQRRRCESWRGPWGFVPTAAASWARSATARGPGTALRVCM